MQSWECNIHLITITGMTAHSMRRPRFRGLRDGAVGEMPSEKYMLQKVLLRFLSHRYASHPAPGSNNHLQPWFDSGHKMSPQQQTTAQILLDVNVE